MDSDEDITTIEEKIRTAFLAEGVRQTRQRDLIASKLAELAGSGVDFSVEKLWHDLQEDDPHMGRATVFRSVEMLARAGLLNSDRFCGWQPYLPGMRGSAPPPSPDLQKMSSRGGRRCLFVRRAIDRDRAGEWFRDRGSFLDVLRHLCRLSWKPEK